MNQQLTHTFPATMQVTAHQGLRFRSGPGLDFDVLGALPKGTRVKALGRVGDWVRVDLGEDGELSDSAPWHYSEQMAGQRYDVKHPRKYTDREGNERTYWTKCGSAWQRERGGFAIELDYVPVAVDAESGKLKFIAFEQDSREESGSSPESE